MSAITASRLNKMFVTTSGDVVEALIDVELNVEAGEFVAVVGPSGSGKSTLLYSLCGLEQIDSGRVVLDSVDLSELSPDALAKLRREQVGLLTQRYNLIPYLSVRENAEITARLAGRRVDAVQIDDLLRSLGLEGLGPRKPSELSGGQQQRVALARALATSPAVILADEPTGALDSKTGDALVEMLRERATTGTAVVMATHNLQNASRADRVLVMRDGRVCATLAAPSDRAIVDALEIVAGE